MKKASKKVTGLSLSYLELAGLAILFIAIGFILQAGLTNLLVQSFFLRSPQTTVMTIGPQNDLLGQELQSEDFRIAGIQYASNLDPGFVVPGTLDNFNAVIVSQTTACTQAMRKTLAQVVQQGHALILFGDACTQDLNNPHQNGWYDGSDELGALMPARLGNPTTRNISDQFTILSINHPIFNGIKNFAYAGTVTNAFPNNAEILAVFGNTDIDGPNAAFIPAALEKDQQNGGKVIWFAFNPGMLNPQNGEFYGSRNLMLNLLIYTEKTTPGLQINLRYTH